MTSRKHRILAVDDHPTNLEILCGVLSRDYEVDTATSGTEAIEIARQRRPDVILLDIMMPGIDGFEVCRQMRRDPHLRQCKILMLTAKSSTADRLDGFAAGADDYLSKPFDAAELLAKVRVFVRLKSVEEVNQMKSDLLTLLNHETRTPLNGIISPAELLLESDSMPAEERRMWIEMIFNNSKNLLSFIQKATTLNSLTSGNYLLQTAPVLVNEIISNQINLHGRETIQSNLASSVIATVDTAEFGNAIGYLIGYAKRQSADDQSVVVKLTTDSTTANLTISFAGELSSDRIANLFDGLGRTDVFHHHRDQSALELAIANQILELHGCAISIDSTQNQSDIVVTIPQFQPTSASRSSTIDPDVGAPASS